MTEMWALPEIDFDLCSGCGICARHCPTLSVEMVALRPSFVRPLDCTYCAERQAQCPEGAITCTDEITWSDDAG